ncbi:MAG: hypothetical protein ACJ8C4_14125 [Gemmataceae bacterium]
MSVDYVIGLDLGQAQDYTALAVMERPEPIREVLPVYSLRHLQRFPLGTPYTEIVPAIAKLATMKPLDSPTIVVDYTGVGRALVDMLRRAGTRSRIVPVTITGGQHVTQNEDGSYGVPKKELVTRMQLLLQARRLKVAATLPEADTLIEEMQNFRVKITMAANETFGAWREGQHDDLVLAVAVAGWWSEKFQRYTLRPEDICTGGRLDNVPLGVFLT